MRRWFCSRRSGAAGPAPRTYASRSRDSARWMSIQEKLDRLKELRAAAEEGGGPARVKAQHARGKLSARERLDLLLDDGSFVELDRFVTHRSTDFGLEDQKILGRRGRHRVRHDPRPARLRLQPGLHGLRRIALRGARREDREAAGHGAQERGADHRAQRLGRGPHPGGRGQPRRLRRHLPAQHARFGRRAADQPDSRPVRRGARSTLRPSPTSSTWSGARATCS
jgi:hypothetical protein